jgi:hypothetical protein
MSVPDPCQKTVMSKSLIYRLAGLRRTDLLVGSAALEGKILYTLAGDSPRSRAMSATRHAAVPASTIRDTNSAPVRCLAVLAISIFRSERILTAGG